jgi:hypothetical protein
MNSVVMIDDVVGKNLNVCCIHYIISIVILMLVLCCVRSIVIDHVMIVVVFICNSVDVVVIFRFDSLYS